MSTPFLTGFAQALVERLLADALLEIAPGSAERVAHHVASHLAGVTQGGSLIQEVDQALLTCPEVEELYADADTLKEMVQDLRT